MIQLSSLMWVLAFFFAILGFLRGYNRELVALAGALLVMFAILQFDSLLRGTVFRVLSSEQIFMIQAGVFLVALFIMYQYEYSNDDNTATNLQDGLVGAVIGFINGYVVGGALWYFLDINEYPLTEFVTAPAVGSPSFQALNTMPLLLVSGGASATTDVAAIIVVGLLFFVLVVL